MFPEPQLHRAKGLLPKGRACNTTSRRKTLLVANGGSLPTMHDAVTVGDLRSFRRRRRNNYGMSAGIVADVSGPRLGDAIRNGEYENRCRRDNILGSGST